MITTDANELVAEIHDRMPLILAPGDYARWLSDEPDPHELMRPFPPGDLRIDLVRDELAYDGLRIKT